MDLSIIIPCMNEEDNVPKLAAEFMPVAAELARTQSVEVIFIDDGSTDHTLSALTDAFGGGRAPAGVTVRFEKHPANLGLGAALRTGYAAAHGRIIVSTDADGTYRFDTIPALLKTLTPEVDIVTASPYHPQGHVVRRLGPAAGVEPGRLGAVSRAGGLAHPHLDVSVPRVPARSGGADQL